MQGLHKHIMLIAHMQECMGKIHVYGNMLIILMIIKAVVMWLSYY